MRRGKLPLYGDGAQGDSALLCVSYLDETHGAAGFAVAVPGEDAGLRAMVESMVMAWVSVLRTRRVLLAGGEPWCVGGRRVVELVESTLDDGAELVHVVGDLAASPERRVALRERGVVPVTALDEVPDGARVVVGAAGIPEEQRVKAAKRGVRIVDGTCPHIASGKAQVRRYAERGDAVVLVGQRGHASTEALSGQAPDATLVVETTADVEQMRGGDGVSAVPVPSMAIGAVVPMLAALRRRFPKLPVQHPDQWCYQTQDRLATVRELAGTADVVFVLGPPESPETVRLLDVAASNAVAVGGLGDIEPSYLVDVGSVGVVVGGDASEGLRGELLTALGGLGPVAVSELRVQTRTMD